MGLLTWLSAKRAVADLRCAWCRGLMPERLTEPQRRHGCCSDDCVEAKVEANSY